MDYINEKHYNFVNTVWKKDHSGFSIIDMTEKHIWVTVRLAKLHKYKIRTLVITKNSFDYLIINRNTIDTKDKNLSIGRNWKFFYRDILAVYTK